MRFRLALFLVAFASVSSAVPAAAQQVTRQQVPGVTNFARVETTIACAGAIKAEAVPDIKKMGFASIINLRQASEEGANVDAEEAAARAAGINYVHVPFNGSKPDKAVADQFITAITTPANVPAFVHCAGGNRAASMWFIKRLVVDRWDVERASAEATALGMTSDALKQFGVEYARSRKD